MEKRIFDKKLVSPAYHNDAWVNELDGTVVMFNDDDNEIGGWNMAKVSTPNHWSGYYLIQKTWTRPYIAKMTDDEIKVLRDYIDQLIGRQSNIEVALSNARKMAIIDDNKGYWERSLETWLILQKSNLLDIKAALDKLVAQTNILR